MAEVALSFANLPTKTQYTAESVTSLEVRFKPKSNIFTSNFVYRIAVFKTGEDVGGISIAILINNQEFPIMSDNITSAYLYNSTFTLFRDEELIVRVTGLTNSQNITIVVANGLLPLS